MNKKLLAFLLHLGQWACLSSAVTSALITILPLLVSKASWQEVLFGFIFTLVFTVLTSIISHVKDEHLKHALLDTLNATRPLVSWRASAVANMSNDQPPPLKS